MNNKPVNFYFFRDCVLISVSLDFLSDNRVETLNTCQHFSLKAFNEWKRSLHVTGSKESSLQTPSMTAWTPSFSLFSFTMLFAESIVAVESWSWWLLWVSVMSRSDRWPPQTSGLLSETSGKVLHAQTDQWTHIIPKQWGEGETSLPMIVPFSAENFEYNQRSSLCSDCETKHNEVNLG